MPHSRPTSPHVSIYRWQITNTLSILHRFTGLALVFGGVLMVAWLWAASYSPHGVYSDLYSFMGSTLGRLMLMGWTLSFFYHFGNGIRHLFWDIGKGFELRNVNLSGIAVAIFTVAMTGLVWGMVMQGGNCG